MEYKNPLISKALSDKIICDKDGKEIYALDCHNSPICMSYGETFFACSAGANANTRCTRGEKIQIRILNDMNPNATHKPDKPDVDVINNYINA